MPSEASAPAARPWYDRPLPLGRLAGVPVAVSTSWFFIAIAMVVVFTPVVRRSVSGLSLGQGAVVALGYAMILAVSVLLHEVGHALAARSVGLLGSSIEITLWGGHTSFDAHAMTPGRSLYVSVVGPFVNLILGGVGWFVLQSVEPHGVASLLLYMAVFSNLAVGLFNLLPGLPLDGGRVVEAIAWRVSGSQPMGTIVAGWFGRLIVLAAAVVLVLQLLGQRERTGIAMIVIVAVVLIPLWTGAGAAIKHGTMRRRLEGMSAGALLSPVVMLPAGASAQQAVDDGVMEDTVVLALAPDGGHLLRVVPERIEEIDPALLPGTPATAAGVATDGTTPLPPEADGDALAKAALESASGAVLVVDGQGQCIGAVRREDVVAAIEGRRKENA